MSNFSHKPISRKEKYMAYLAGDTDIVLPLPLTREEINLYNACINGAGVMFGEETTVKEVLAECQPEFNAESGQFGILTKFHLEAGQKYIVTVNGIEYHSTAFNPSDVGESIEGVSVLLVNDEYVSGGNMYFAVFVYNEEVVENFGYGGCVQLSDGSTTLTISIRQEVTEVKKISGKYVEGMGYKEPSYTEVYGWSGTTDEYKSAGDIHHSIGLKLGEVYSVICDGVEYLCECKQGIDSEYYIGNAEIGGNVNPGQPHTDEPFNVSDFYYGSDTNVNFATGGEHSISIREVSETIHPIDQKFIVLTSPNGTQYNLSVADDGTLSAVAAT